MTNSDVLTMAVKSLGVMSENTITGRGLRRFLNDITRCKDCKHWLSTSDNKKDTCSVNCVYMHDPDFFCAYGEAVRLEG